MSKIKDAAIKALATNIPIHEVGKRAWLIANLTEEDAVRMLEKAAEAQK
jgi:hypothetical protein